MNFFSRHGGWEEVWRISLLQHFHNLLINKNCQPLKGNYYLNQFYRQICDVTFVRITQKFDIQKYSFPLISRLFINVDQQLSKWVSKIPKGNCKMVSRQTWKSMALGPYSQM